MTLRLNDSVRNHIVIRAGNDAHRLLTAATCEATRPILIPAEQPACSGRRRVTGVPLDPDEREFSRAISPDDVGTSRYRSSVRRGTRGDDTTVVSQTDAKR
jgi:hypothetical protein